jgi:hypothetical protein
MPIGSIPGARFKSALEDSVEPHEIGKCKAAKRLKTDCRLGQYRTFKSCKQNCGEVGAARLEVLGAGEETSSV